MATLLLKFMQKFVNRERLLQVEGHLFEYSQWAIQVNKAPNISLR
jgi:hypothetical protein